LSRGLGPAGHDHFKRSISSLGKSFTPLNAARGPRAAHPVAALGRPIFYVFRPFLFVFHFFVSGFSSFMFPFSAIIYIIIFLI
jgi:hypothetical protein